MLESGVEVFVGAHCTGINSTYSIREFMGLDSKNVLVGSVGTFISKEGVFLDIWSKQFNLSKFLNWLTMIIFF